MLTKKTVQENTQTKYNSEKANNAKYSKTKLPKWVQSPLTTLGHKRELAYRTTPPSPKAAAAPGARKKLVSFFTPLLHVEAWSSDNSHVAEQTDASLNKAGIRWSGLL